MTAVTKRKPWTRERRKVASEAAKERFNRSLDRTCECGARYNEYGRGLPRLEDVCECPYPKGPWTTAQAEAVLAMPDAEFIAWLEGHVAFIAIRGFYDLPRAALDRLFSLAKGVTAP